MNVPVLVGIIVQAVVAQYNRLAGAAIGFIITTGILLWGLNAYSDGYVIALFGINLSKTAFLVAILIWYAVDVNDVMRALNAPAPQPEVVPASTQEG